MRSFARTAAVAIAVMAVAAALGITALRTGGGPDTLSTPITVAPDLPAEVGFVASPLDVEGAAKVTAARFVERVGTWQAAGPVDVAARLTEAGYGADLAPTAEPLFDIPALESDTTIIYPQYGGLTDTAASVMVLARQTLRTSAGEQARHVLLDIRLTPRDDGTWEVGPNTERLRPELAPAREGGPTATGRRVLENPRLRISDPGRSDIAGGRVGDPILAVLDQVARTRTLDVHVLVSGHPSTVFSTTRLSNHSVGRAVDIWAVDGRPVVDIPRDDPVLTELMIDAGAAGATEVGGPVVPVGTGFFTDDVHQDHFHLGITPGKPPASAS